MVCRCLVILGNADHSRSTSQFVQVGNSQAARRAVRFEENNERGFTSQIESGYRGRALADVEHRTRLSQTCLRTLPANPTQAPDKAAARSMRKSILENLHITPTSYSEHL